MDVAVHQKKMGKRRQEKRENKCLILKRLHAALLRLFRRQPGEKMASMRRVPGVTGTLRKANSHFDPTETGSETASPC